MSSPIFWLFGLPSSGKTTLSYALRLQIASGSNQVVILDGDELRKGLCSDLGFSDQDRSENLRRAAEMAKLLANQGLVVICAFITPKEHHRELIRRSLGEKARLVHVECPLEICVSRDVKGLYRKALQRQISGMTGLQDEFEAPKDCDIVVNTHSSSLAICTETILSLLPRM